MKSNNGYNSQLEGDDKLSMLTDDILVSILGRVDIRTAARTTVLSTRWRNLPWLLPELNIDVKDFLRVPCSHPIEAIHMDEAMSSLTKAARSFLAAPQRECPITRLCLKLYLIGNFLCDIGPLVGEAIDSGMIKDLDLAILDEKEPPDCRDEEMLQQAHDVNGFFSACPSVLHCLTRLSLYNVCFGEWDMHHVLFDSCKQLLHMTLFHCDAGNRSVWKIDAPNSKLSVLELYTCCFERLELICLPKLEKLHWDTWISHYSPLSFGFVPSLKELHLLCGTSYHHQGFKLSELLHGTAGIHTLTLDFQGEKLWMQPELKQLRTAFNKLRKLSVLGIFVEFDLIWTSALLQAAPSVEIFHIQVWEHACEVDSEDRRRTFPKRTSPSWEMLDFNGPKNWLLKEFQLIGFRPLEQQLIFIRAVMERAPNLVAVVLKDDEACEDCDAIGTPPRSSTECIFPKNKDEQEMVVKQLRDGLSSPAQIIFGN